MQILLVSSLSIAYGIEAIDNNTKHLFFIDDGTILKYDIATLKQGQQLKICKDTAFINSFYRKWIIPNNGPNLNNVTRRFAKASYFNLTCYNQKVFIAVSYISFDTTKDSRDYLLLEYTKELNFTNFYMLKGAGISAYGNARLYPWFKLHFNKTDEVLLFNQPSIFKVNSPDSAFNFCVYKLDAKKNEMRFSKVLNSPKPEQDITTDCFCMANHQMYCYPIEIPISFSLTPCWFHFPYVVLRNWNGKNTFDPFHHIRYAHDSLNLVLNGISNNFQDAYKLIFPSRESLSAYSYQNDTLKFLLKNYGGEKDKLAVMTIIGSKYQVAFLKALPDSENTFFHFVVGKVVGISKEGNEYLLNWAN